MKVKTAIILAAVTVGATTLVIKKARKLITAAPATKPCGDSAEIEQGPESEECDLIPEPTDYEGCDCRCKSGE